MNFEVLRRSAENSSAIFSKEHCQMTLVPITALPPAKTLDSSDDREVSTWLPFAGATKIG